MVDAISDTVVSGLKVGVGLTIIVDQLPRVASRRRRGQTCPRGVELIPEVPSGLPVPALPPIDGATTMLPYALAIALMAFNSCWPLRNSARASQFPKTRRR